MVRQSENAKRVLERGDMRTRGLFIMLSGKAKMYVMTEQERNLTDPDVLSRAQHRMRHLPAPPAPREMFTEVLTTGDFFGEVPLVFGVPSTFAVDVQPGSQFVCLLKEAFTDRFMPRIDSPDGEMQMRLWSAHRAYMDLPGNIYFKHSLSREFTKSLPINPKFSSLCNVPSFTGLPYRLLLALSQEKEVTICQPGKTMFRKGLPSTDLHILLTGCVQLEDRHGKVLAEFSANCSKPGIALGEHAFWRSLENAVTCRAMSTCQFVFYSKGHLLKVLRSMKGEDAEYGKAHFKSLVESWDVLHRNIPDDIRQQYPLGYNQDILEYRLLQIPAFSKLRKADLYKLSLSMVVRKFTKQQNIVQDDSELACVIVSGKARLVLPSGQNEPDLRAGDWMWCKMMEAGTFVQALDDVIAAQFPSDLVLQCLSKSLTHVEGYKDTIFLHEEAFDVLGGFADSEERPTHPGDLDDYDLDDPDIQAAIHGYNVSIDQFTADRLLRGVHAKLANPKESDDVDELKRLAAVLTRIAFRDNIDHRESIVDPALVALVAAAHADGRHPSNPNNQQ
ncbi:uncharacterized protein LOC135821313 isoform X2 [Sycon ciliatum]|uniref:uncharacterized protein LOC135821313 isoform X2 n=1 Tax=Sycon ciliatum TaxID=27933 RepID=UPI0031F5F629